MSLAFDNNSGGHSSAGVQTFSLSHTNNGNILLVGIGLESATDILTGALYNNVAMTLIDKLGNTAGDEWTYLYYILNPSTGANNITVNTSSNTTIRITGSSYTGALQSGQPDNHNKGNTHNTGTNTVSVTPNAANCWVITVGQSDAGTLADSTNVTNRGADGTNVRIGDSNGPVSAGSGYSQTYTSGGSDINMISASIAPIVGGINRSYSYFM